MVYRGKEGHDGVEEGGEVGGDPVSQGQSAHVRQVLHQVPDIHNILIVTSSEPFSL